MVKKDSVKVILLTAICTLAFVGFFNVVMEHPLVGVYGTVFFAVYPRIQNAYQKSKEKNKKEEP